MLKDRLKQAMEGPPRVTQTALAKACHVSAPTVNDWLSGKSKAMRGEHLVNVARFLRVTPEWLATGKGTRTETSSRFDDKSSRILNEPPNPAPTSHSTGPTSAILAAALTWADFEEGPGRRFARTYLARAERVLELCAMIEADGGMLSPANTQALIAAAEQRFAKLEGATSARSRTGGGASAG